MEPGSMRDSFGAPAPSSFDRAVMRVTARLPLNWWGRRVAIVLRRLVTMRLARDGALDVSRWGLRMRLHPRDNGCEKNLLFTPQMFEPVELSALARALEARPATFIDVGANVGLWSLYAASVAPHAKIVAIEPEPGNLERLRFNIGCNSDLKIEVIGAALLDAPGTVGLDCTIATAAEPGRLLSTTKITSSSRACHCSTWCGSRACPRSKH
jgi:hypothetical protein